MRHDPDLISRLVRDAAATNRYVTTASLLLQGASRYDVRRATDLGLLVPLSAGLHGVTGADSRDWWLDRVERAAAHTGPDAVAARGTAARLHGISGSPPTRALEFVVPVNRRPTNRPGVSITRAAVDPEDLKTLPTGLQLTSPLRSVVDCSRYGDHVSAVSLIESALRDAHFTKDEFRARLHSLVRAPGVARARHALDRADVRSESPLETALRLLLLDGGLPQPVPQLPFEHGGISGRIDLAYPAIQLGGKVNGRYRGLAIEADGRATHEAGEAFHHDRFRQTVLEEAGWLVRRFTDRHVRRQPAFVVAAVKRALDTVRTG